MLIANYPSRVGSSDSIDALDAGWWAVISRKSWITAGVFQRAVLLTLSAVKDYLPPVAEFVAICEIAQGELEDEAARARPALPAPQAHIAPEIDPTDPYSCTPEERERWAREDAWIRAWDRNRLKTAPEILARLSVEERERVLDSERRDDSVAKWPALTPAARRAKDARIERERQEAMAWLRAQGKGKLADMLDRVIPPTYDRETPGFDRPRARPATAPPPREQRRDEWVQAMDGFAGDWPRGGTA